MAMFREHVAFGAIISMLVVVAVYFYALVTDPLLLLFLFGVTVIGSFLPDVDSDSGMPFYLVFGTMTLAATGVVLLYTLNSTYAADWRYLTGIPAGALLIFWFIVGGVVKKCTHHRGIFHSLPALAISGVGSFLVARHYGLDENIAWIFGGAMAAGYLCHLILDELHAGITLDGIPFNPKSSFGSALKLFSDSNRVNMATYLLLATLAYVALGI
ncbi:MAG: metal-dependent hydrolase [Minisyncoccia bacterium]